MNKNKINDSASDLKVKNRKIVQLLLSQMHRDASQNVIYALCDDGTLWWKNELDGVWQLEMDIPQR